MYLATMCWILSRFFRTPLESTIASEQYSIAGIAHLSHRACAATALSRPFLIQTELDTLKEQGYCTLLAGDFNAHVGNDSQGIPRNNKDINWNGKLVREFIHTNNLSIVNKDVRKRYRLIIFW